MFVDIKYCNDKLPPLIRELSLCDEQLKNLQAQKETLNFTLNGLQKDVTDITKVKDEYKDKYVKLNQQLIDEKESKPSRYTWFGAGFITALILGIAAAIAIK